jgi:hypothetical protein
VIQRADPGKPTPVMPHPPIPKKPELSLNKPRIDPKLIKEMSAASREKKQEYANDSVALDKSIEEIRTDGQDPLQAAMSKNMLYYAKYGQFKGGVNA